jgi:hypothetical protein|tara:strand:- start:723 stop:986 length:264 start_codon:yes stop_codon:yes gene_type:complete
MVTKLILNSKINSERRKRIKLEYERESLIKQLMVLEKFNNQIINLESPNGHIGRLRSPIILGRLIKEAKHNIRILEDVRLQEKAKQL